jgi:hypothetical protein
VANLPNVCEWWSYREKIKKPGMKGRGAVRISIITIMTSSQPHERSQTPK